jgi:hypothetical protein
MSDKVPVSVGILSYRAPKTIAATLDAYAKHNFLDIFSEVKLFFQCVSDEDIQIAEKHKLEWCGRADNIGIQNGMRWVVENLNSEYILYLENDCPLVVDATTAEFEINRAVKYLASGQIDVMRLRSRFTPGEQFADVRKYTTVHTPSEIDERFVQTDEVQISHQPEWRRFLKRFFYPSYGIRMMGRSLYIEKGPERLFPKYVWKTDDGMYIVDSKVINWTNQSILTTKEFFLQMLDHADRHPRSRTVNGFQDMEKPLNGRWWRQQHFKIGVSDGLFTHKRLDR